MPPAAPNIYIYMYRCRFLWCWAAVPPLSLDIFGLTRNLLCRELRVPTLPGAYTARELAMLPLQIVSWIRVLQRCCYLRICSAGIDEDCTRLNVSMVRCRCAGLAKFLLSQRAARFYVNVEFAVDASTGPRRLIQI